MSDQTILTAELKVRIEQAIHRGFFGQRFGVDDGDVFTACVLESVWPLIDAELAVLRARLTAWERAMDEWYVVNWIGVYAGEDPVTAVKKALVGALDVERDELRAKLAQSERELQEWRGYRGFLLAHGMMPPGVIDAAEMETGDAK